MVQIVDSAVTGLPGDKAHIFARRDAVAKGCVVVAQETVERRFAHTLTQRLKEQRSFGVGNRGIVAAQRRNRAFQRRVASSLARPLLHCAEPVEVTFRRHRTACFFLIHHLRE